MFDAIEKRETFLAPETKIRYLYVYFFIKVTDLLFVRSDFDDVNHVIVGRRNSRQSGDDDSYFLAMFFLSLFLLFSEVKHAYRPLTSPFSSFQRASLQNNFDYIYVVSLFSLSLSHVHFIITVISPFFLSVVIPFLIGRMVSSKTSFPLFANMLILFPYCEHVQLIKLLIHETYDKVARLPPPP